MADEYRSPKVTTDAVIVKDERVVLVKRLNPPYQDMWALPGGFVDYGEKVEDACVREAREETSLDVKIKKLVGVYSDPGRDPRGHTVGVAYLCEVVGGKLEGGDDAKEAQWFPLNKLPKLAFDHVEIINDLSQ
ncbi:MAG: NUDIX hydrolase [Candidatus Altiarchaeota archaeon]|nr:NUDIX hydrolase [Candidatus Altiarchaeota archaeon]